MSSIAVMVAGAWLGAAVCAGTRAAGAAVSAGGAPTGTSPTFGRDVAPILRAHCVGCHRAGGVAAAQPLQSTADARRLAAAIGRTVVARTMPPWPADSAHSLRMRNDAGLGAADIDIIARWVASGAAEGTAADVPPMPEHADRWAHPQGTPPDLVLSLPTIRVPANGEIPYSQQRVKIPGAHDRWVSAIQVLPGNYSLVHHMGITEVTLADGLSSDALDTFALAAAQIGMPDGVLAAQGSAVTDPLDGADDMFAVYTPGTTFEMYRDGDAKLLKAGPNAYMNFNLHFTTTGRAETSRAQLALWFRPGPPARQLFRAPVGVESLVANGRELLTDEPGSKAEGTNFAIPPIAPYVARYELVGMTAYTEPVTLYQLQPHAHMRAKDFKYAVVYPDGHEVVALTVPNFDFHWQIAYDLETPLRLPAGSKVIVTAHYDNSADNPHLKDLGSRDLAQHCGPDKQVYFKRQNQSWDEMFTPLVQYVHDDLDPRRPQAARHALPLVDVVGCLVRGGGHRWRLEKSSDPVESRMQSTSAQALATSATRVRRDLRYELLGIDAFRPDAQTGRAVSVKGVLIADAAAGGNGGGAARINVTSFEPVGDCP